MAELVWHLDAIADLESIAAYIARDSRRAAAQFTARIVEASHRLRVHPRLGRRVPEIGDESYRELIFQNYRIVYRLLNDRVTLLGVLHAAMDLESQAERRAWDIT